MNTLAIFISVFLVGLYGCEVFFAMFMDSVINYWYLFVFTVSIAVFATMLRTFKD